MDMFIAQYVVFPLSLEYIDVFVGVFERLKLRIFRLRLQGSIPIKVCKCET